MPKVSVIIPVYNSENYLEKCLDSVCNQTLKDIEIICVNDCSTDNSLDILNQYAKKYSNIKVIDCKVNAGESKARNIGLENAAGEYLAFVDNDDTIDLDFCEKLYKKAKKTNADISKGEARIFEFKNQIIRKYNSKLFFKAYWWTAIYKRTLITNNNIKFIENYPLGGDVLFLNQALIHADKLELSDEVYYNYHRREDSGDSRILSLEKIESVLNIQEKIIDNINCNINNLDKIGVLHVYHLCVSSGINYAYRRKTLESLEFCINKTFSMYAKCLYKKELNEELKKDYTIETDYLINNDAEGLMKYLKKYDTTQKRFFASMRYKQKLRSVNNA